MRAGQEARVQVRGDQANGKRVRFDIAEPHAAGFAVHDVLFVQWRAGKKRTREPLVITRLGQAEKPAFRFPRVEISMADPADMAWKLCLSGAPSRSAGSSSSS